MTESLRSFAGVSRSEPTTFALLEIPVARPREPIAQLGHWLPPEERVRARDVRTSSRGIARRQWLERQLGGRARNLPDEVGELEHRELVRVADVDRFDDAGVVQGKKPGDFVVHVAEGARLCAVAVDRQRLAFDRLDKEVRNDTTVGGTETRTVSVEDAHDARSRPEVPVIRHRQRL